MEARAEVLYHLPSGRKNSTEKFLKINMGKTPEIRSDLVVACGESPVEHLLYKHRTWMEARTARELDSASRKKDGDRRRAFCRIYDAAQSGLKACTIADGDIVLPISERD